MSPASVSAVRLPTTSGLSIQETFYAPHVTLASHYHARASLSLVLAGAQRERVGRRLHDCAPLSVVFKTAEVDHSDHVGKRGMHGVFVELTPSTLDAFREMAGTPADVATCTTANSRALVRRVGRELRVRQPGYELVIEGLVYELLAEIVRMSGPGHRGLWVARARDYVAQHFRDRISLRDVALYAGVHPSHLAVAFREAYGCTVGEYARNLRVEHARRAIQSGTRTLSEIAQNAGFADQSHLTRLFRERMGVTPGDYRRLNSTPAKLRS